MDKECKIDLPVLHDFGAIGVQDDASIILPIRDEPDTDQPPHIVPGKTSTRSVSPVTFPNIAGDTSCF